jgi:hypothetical protein
MYTSLPTLRSNNYVHYYRMRDLKFLYNTYIHNMNYECVSLEAQIWNFIRTLYDTLNFLINDCGMSEHFVTTVKKKSYQLNFKVQCCQLWCIYCH